MTKRPGDPSLAAGMDDYLSKPIRVDELVAALRKCGPLPGDAGAPLAARPKEPADS